MNITQRFTAVVHPQVSGQVDVTNRTIVDEIKNKLERAGGEWANELHGVLWANRTSPKEATGETPFVLVHGVEAVLPLELEVHTARILKLHHQEALRDELEFALEKREGSSEKMRKTKGKIKAAYDKKTRKRKFGVGDWVLRQADALKNTGKLEANWEGPYKHYCLIRGSIRTNR